MSRPGADSRRWRRRAPSAPLLGAGLAAALAVGFGGGQAHAMTWLMVEEGSPLAYRPGHSAPPAAWPTLGYVEDGTWTASAAGFGIGYGDGDDRTVLGAMSGSYLTVYVRARFTVGSELGSIQHLELEVSFDDGFVAYLNGTEIGRASVPVGPLLPSDPASDHEASLGPVSFVVDPGLLVAGENVLAAEVHNASLSSSDLSFLPRLYGWDVPPPSATITRGPYLQQVGRRSALVVWETDAAAPSTVIHGATDALGLLTEETTPKTRHVVELTGLRPNEPHYYQVQSARWPSPVARFHTEVDRAEPYRVLAFGDTRSGDAEHAAVIAQILPHEPHLGLHSGDLVADGDQASLWDAFFRIEAPLLRQLALCPALGNHEASGSHYLDAFELPPSSPGAERYYAVRYAGTLAVSLDLYGSAFDVGSAQYTWLDQTLAAAAQDASLRHRWVMLHHGPYDSGSHGSELTVRAALVPLFEAHGVELVLSGHDHDYERGTVNGVKYVVSGGGGAPLYAVAGGTWTEASAVEYHYCTVDVHGPRLELTARRLDGSVLDSFVSGEDGTECVLPADCAALPAGACEADEQGEWHCLYGACIWSCALATLEPPDAGVGGAAGGAGMAGAAGAAGVPGSGGSAGAAGGPSLRLEPGAESGCGCRLAPTPGAGGWLGLGGVGAGLRARRRRRGPGGR